MYCFVLVVDSTSEEKSVAAIYLLPQLLAIPPSKSKKSEKYWKPARPEIQEGFVTHVHANSQIQEVVDLRKRKFASLGRSIQPFVIAVGRDILNLEEAYVIIDEVFYKFDSLLKAIDGCFKTFQATGAQYPEESNDVWKVIEIVCYKIDTCSNQRLTQAVKHCLANLRIPHRV